jgi:hypothetical protein
MSNVSFQGHITVITWNKTVSSFKKYPTTKVQDKLIKRLAKNLGEKDVVHTVNKRQANFLYKLIERFTGRKITKANNDKVFYHNSDQIVFSDKNPVLYDGVRVESELD